MQIEETMAYPRKYVEHRILGLESQLNQHLIKLIAFEFPPELRQHFKREVRNWLDQIQVLRFKPNDRTGSVKFYYDILYDWPFGGVEARNVGLIMRLVSREYDGIRPTKPPEELVNWLRAFHRRLAERLHAGEDVLDMIPE